MSNEMSVSSTRRSLLCWVLLLIFIFTDIPDLCSASGHGLLVKKEDMISLVSTEYGEISAVPLGHEYSPYLLHFFTLEPNSLFLPVILHQDMVFYVRTGTGKLSWTEEDEVKKADLRQGDVFSLPAGTVFFLQSYLQTNQMAQQQHKLRIHALFTYSPHNNVDIHHNARKLPYSSIRDMVLGFNKKVLQAAFKVSEEVIEELLNGTKPEAIVHGIQESRKENSWEFTAPSHYQVQFVRGLLGSTNIFRVNKKTKTAATTKLFNLFKEKKDFENGNGWSTTVTAKKLSALKGTDIGLFMVNLTQGSMMGPHWNPTAAEISVVLEGQGIVRILCSRVSKETKCEDMVYKVEEGDVFVVPRFHPMAQVAFSNGSFVFGGFSTSSGRNHPQYLAGKASVFWALDKEVLALSFNVTNTTLDLVLGQQQDSVILRCVSCAEEELRVMEEKEEKEREEAREEEERKREEEARRREEEEEMRKRREEEEAQREEEEEEARRRQEEEEARREEERKHREEEEARRRQEEEERKHREEEEARKKEEEEEAWREEEERKHREEEEARRRQEEEEARREEEERKRREEEEARKKEEEEEAWREEEERKHREEEEARKRAEEEEEAWREEEERKHREEEEARKRAEEEEEAWREEEERKQREEEEARKRKEEEEAARRGEEEGKHQEEEARKRDAI